MTLQAVAQTACLTVVILHDPYKENNPGSRTLVILTNNGPVNKSFKAYDAYNVNRLPIPDELIPVYRSHKPNRVPKALEIA